MKPNKQKYIDFILSNLEKGNVQYKDVMLVFVSKFKLVEQTFVRYWKTANEQYRITQELINKVKLDETISQEKEAVKRNILTKFRAQEILTEIAEGKPKKIQGQIIMPTSNERRGAIETMAKLEGWDAPTKIENTIVNYPMFGTNPLDEK